MYTILIIGLVVLLLVISPIGKNILINRTHSLIAFLILVIGLILLSRSGILEKFRMPSPRVGGLGGPCNPDGKCSRDILKCQNNVCILPGSISTSPSTGGLGNACNIDSNCMGSFKCVENKCRVKDLGYYVPCDAFNLCESKYKCVNGRCS